MVRVAQLVRVLGCGPSGRGFKSRLAPQFFFPSVVPTLFPNFLPASAAIKKGQDCSLPFSFVSGVDFSAVAPKIFKLSA